MSDLQPKDSGSPADGFAPTAAPLSASEERTDVQLGRYKLLQKIGEGGCGTVYLAEQSEPVHRRVALKVIKLGMDTKEVIARFEAERQALAMMDHPNIAKVFDAGTTEGGRPYFVMELVQGVPITTFCDEKKLSTSARLELFILVCHAVQHAHQKGIIHRDIKPSNILVALHDDQPVPKVIDFGIAKATGGRLTDQTLYTAVEQFIGTPAYMSPEQAQVSVVDIDTRADIYSLGVLLYELLTGRTPFDTAELLKVGLDEMRRHIREVDPPRPSTRLSTLQGEVLSTMALRRQIAAPKLLSLIRGDLDWIVMRCLEKDRARRYETANGLAADLQHHLIHEPVAARPPSASYRLGKMIRRNKLLFAAASAMAAALVIGLGMSTWAFIKEKAARERAVAAESEQSRLRKQAEIARSNEAAQRAVAEAARNEEARQRGHAEEARVNEAKQRVAAEANEKKAITEAARSGQAFRFVAGMLTGVGPSVAAGRDTALLREILDKTVRRLGKELKDQPEVEVNLRTILAGVYLDLGEVTKAEGMALDALARGEKLHGRAHKDVTDAIATLGAVRLMQGRTADADNLSREAVAIREKLGDDSDHKLAGLYLLQGIGQRSLAKFAEAETSLRRGLALVRKYPDPESSGLDQLLAMLGSVLVDQGRLAEGEPLIREALDAQKRLYGGEHPTVGQILVVLSNVLREQGKLSEASATFDEAYEITKKNYGAEHLSCAILLPNKALILMRQGRTAEAEKLLRETITLQKKVCGPESRYLAGTLQLLTLLLQQSGKTSEAEAVKREVDSLQIKLAGHTEFAEADARVLQGNAAAQQGKWQEAEKSFREALLMLEKIGGAENINTIQVRSMLAGAVFRQGRSGEAEVILRDMLEASRKAFGNRSKHVADGLLQLARSLLAQGKLAETETSLREMLAIAKTFTTDGENAKVAEALLVLATVRARLGDLAEGATLARTAADVARKLPDKEEDSSFSVADGMARGLRGQGKPVEAEAIERVQLEYARRLDGPESERVAGVLIRLGQSLNGAGKFAEAEPVAREGWLMRKKLRPPTDWLVAHAQSVLGESLFGLKKYAEAESSLLAAFADMQKYARDATKAGSFWRGRQRDTADCLAKLYAAIRQKSKATEWQKTAAAYTGQATASTTGKKPADPDLAALIAEDDRLKQQGKLTEAEAIERRMLELAIARNGRESTLAANHLVRLAQTLNQIGKYAEAEQLARESLQLREKLESPGHWNIASARQAVGNSLLAQKRLAEAEPLLLRAYADLLAAEPNIPAAYKSRVSESAGLLAKLYEGMGQLEKAAEWKRTAKDHERTSDGANATGAIPADAASELVALASQAESLKKQGKLAEAAQLLATRLEIQKSRLGSEHPDTLKSITNLANAYDSTREYAKAESLHRELLAVRLRKDGADSTAVATVRAVLGRNLLRQKKNAEAEPILREALAVREQKSPNDWQTFDTRSVLGDALAAQKKFSEAEPLLLSGYEGVKARETKLSPSDKTRLRDALRRLVSLYKAWQKPAQAAEWQKTLDDISPAEAQKQSPK